MVSAAIGTVFVQESADTARAHWTQICSTNPLKRLNAGIKLRTRVVGIFPNDASITRIIGAVMLEQDDEWSLNRRYLQLEGLKTLSDTVPTRLSAAAWTLQIPRVVTSWFGDVNTRIASLR